MDGYYGRRSDIYSADDNPIHQAKALYWETKYRLKTKVAKKKEDEHMIASDAEVDSKIETFRSIKRTSDDLMRLLQSYDCLIHRLAQNEFACARFVNVQSSGDKSRAGKMLQATGKIMSFNAQQRLQMRGPITRLRQEVETFRMRAVGDTDENLVELDELRNDYRAALSWMKDVSSELDPDEYRRLEKFRRVQTQVKRKKDAYDHLKVGVMQKVDMLAASRSNMFSHALENYQKALLEFWQTSSQALTIVANAFEGYQYYEFNIVKELIEPTKKLADILNKPKEDVDGVDIEEILDKLDRMLDDLARGKHVSVEDMHRSLPAPSPHSSSKNEPSEEEAAILLNVNSGGAASSSKAAATAPTKSVQNEDNLIGGSELATDMKLFQDILDLSGADAAGDLLDLNFGEEEGEPTASALTSSKDFANEWKDLDFGVGSAEKSELLNLRGGGSASSAAAQPTAAVTSAFLPSHLLDFDPSSAHATSALPPKNRFEANDEKDKWFNMFAELDPLANPDAVGKQSDDLLQA